MSTYGGNNPGDHRNVTNRYGPAGYTCYYYDETGSLINTSVNGHVATIAVDGTKNYAVPATITTNTTTTMTWSGFFGMQSNTGPNGDQASVVYDSYGRVARSTSPYGAITYYDYTGVTSSPPFTVATLDGRKTKTTMDGFGRTVRVERFDSNGVEQSVADTNYVTCGCSPLGKVGQVSQPYAVGATPVYTTYTYDGLGRMVTSVAPDGASTTGYSYWSHVTDITDPAGNWKQYVSDTFGNLTTVREPNPAYPGDDNWTNYTYDLLNHLTQVNQQVYVGMAYTYQYRTFNYGNGAYLLSATNPENGTVTYTYNADGTVATKTDAKSQRAVYSYDAYGRVTMVQRGTVSGGTFTEDKTQRTTLGWDTNTVNSTYSVNTLGRLATVQYNGTNGTDTFADMYSYTAAGLVTGKGMQISRPSEDGSFLVSAGYVYDGEGRVTSMTYPDVLFPPAIYGEPPPTPGATMSYAFDAMGRPYTLAQAGGQTFVTGATYGPSDEPLSVTAFGIGNGWSYNAMLQVRQAAQDGIQMTYGYSPTRNNGKIVSATDAVLGETVNYTYDSLNRLASATATDNAWGNSYVYDGFGNLLQKNVTAGSAPSLAQGVNVGNNWIVGNSYDANGNQTSTYIAGTGNVQLQYDNENRMTAINGAGASYAYNAQNQRVWRKTVVSGKTTETFYFYGIDGKMLAAYTPTVYTYQGAPYMALGTEERGLYFAGRLVGRSDSVRGTGVLEAVSTDGIGTARWDNSLGGVEASFFPWGEERGTVTGNDRVKFATYRRDSESSLDYGGNRYYSSVTGRFLSADPYQANSGGAGNTSDPQSWNRYAYTRGDPVGRYDPWGTCDTSGDTDTSVTVCADSDPGENGGPVKVDDSGTGLGDSHTPPGGGSGGASKKQIAAVERAFSKALAVALGALTNPNCWNLFAQPGIDSSGNVILHPGTLLSDLATGTGNVGGIGIGNIRSDPGTIISATATAVIVHTSAGQVYPEAMIKLNAVGGSFVTGTTTDQAITLLHELGHAEWDIYGAGSSQIVPDGTTVPNHIAVSMNNTALIKSHCFK